ncbi:hypothetical protein [Crassaminicella indica]|uniref:Uncharacterized protein n=1 Tax=Crassaminicella indica TaxID=2855394 RepID=A0ABX8RC57_9CLOT|nr:hypothetical protein [Crassaminicella indica]QXM06630.1 hypothetical protein KVH43_02450 [Crassaminicella indica]
MSRNRLKIHLTFNKATHKKLDYISTKLFITKGSIIDELIEYILKKELACKYTHYDRDKLTTTVNPSFWIQFKEYADENKFKYNHLIELAMSKRYRHYLRKIQALRKT